jgi:hypothetical protein
MTPDSKLPTPMGKFAASCTNITQFLSSRQTKTDETLPVLGDSGGKKLEVPSLQNYIIQENLTTLFANSKYKQNIRIADIIQQTSILLVLNVSIGFICRFKNTNNASPSLPESQQNKFFTLKD